MNNQDVIDMVAIGLSDELIIDKIHATPSPNFDTSVAALKSLKANKVSDSVIRAMINPHPQTAASTSSAGSAAKDSSRVPDEVGVYVVQQGKPVEMQPEIVNWQTGGVIKSAVTVGIVKGDRNGKVMNPRSALQIATPVDFIIKTPEGTSATEYQLLRLHEKGNRREFRATTGGVFHQSGGAQPNLIAITPEKIGPRTWIIRLSSLSNGEYGFLPPGIESASISSSGKVYSFGVVGSSTQVQHAVSPSPVNEPQGKANTFAESKNAGEGSLGLHSDLNHSQRHDGVPLSGVDADGPAAQAGIEPGDVILSIDNQYIYTIDEMNTAIRRLRPGTRVAMRYQRRAAIVDTYVIVGKVR